MASGALVGARCFSSNAEATDAVYSAAPIGQSVGQTTYLSEFVQSSGTWVVRRSVVASDGTVTQMADAQAPALSFPVCDTTGQFTDGMTVGWGVVAAMAAAWAIVALRRGL
jgi:hypothetical protein